MAATERLNAVFLAVVSNRHFSISEPRQAAQRVAFALVSYRRRNNQR